MQVLFIAYFFKPYPGVGSKRLSYWADHIQDYKIKPSVITSVPQKEESNYPIYVLPNTNRKRLLSSVLKDQGYSWFLDLKDFFSTKELPNFDAIVISGGPFMHFSITKLLKQKYPNSKIILDYRDPFAVNPRFNDGFFKLKLKSYFEKKFNKYADEIVAVNRFCAASMSFKKTIQIIDNGYDDEVLNKTITKNNINSTFLIAHAGNFYGNKNITPFLQTISTNFNHLVNFEHYGQHTAITTAFLNKSNISYKGLLPYPKLVEELSKCDATVLFTSGAEFESTTKIFDYLALNKRILIITNGIIKTGALHDITQKYPNVLWCKNDVSSIKTALTQLIKMPVVKFDTSIYARKTSLEKLIAILN